MSIASLYEKFGGSTFPLNDSAAATAGIFPDPVRDYWLAIFEAAIVSELQTVATPSWTTVATGTSLAGTSPVQDRFPAIPTPKFLLERKADWPLLCLGRATGEFGRTGKEEELLTCQWEAHWILGPLTVGEEHRFAGAIGDIVPKLFNRVVEQRCHPAYTPPGLNGDGLRPDGKAFKAGDTPFGPGGIELGGAESVSYDAGAAQIGDRDTFYHGVTYRFTTTEYASLIAEAHAVPVKGASHTIDVGGYEGLVPGLLQLDTDHPRRER